MTVRYLTHPQVLIEPDKQVDRWGLNDVGRARVASIARAPALRGTRSVISSAETKAIETAQPIADALGLKLVVREKMHENDRTATGFLVPEEFEAVADRFFATPDLSVRGWERAVDAQARIVAEAMAAIHEAPEGDVLLVGHGAVGTLLMCHVGRMAIHRSHDQAAGGGNVFAFARLSHTLIHGWQPMESLTHSAEASTP
ncbi:broad specificity phosphatase PhoE [Hoeflea marina]|uniref:Broad specificity phosphatase PhoE n=1 Tax=Hoeflea marina TaxID=274592 RepID=A0A317PT37_9HYPH|nr:histidine phosphatase family protein [Hoeflea marina]PWW03935.1 broad specificity phosphatase PhoE [Hoeflea marina]